MNPKTSRNPGFSYTPYGHSSDDLGTRLLFNGEILSRPLQAYLLGMGRRAYIPTLMRFSSPDRLSPFDKGGINAYSYCSGDPINFRDPSGLMKEGARPMRRGSVVLSPWYGEISRRPVKLKQYNTSESPLQRLFDEVKLGQLLTKYLDFKERTIIEDFFPIFSAHNSRHLAQSLKNSKVQRPPSAAQDHLVAANFWRIPLQDMTAQLQRKATATSAGYMYGPDQIGISTTRTLLRGLNDQLQTKTNFASAFELLYSHSIR